MSVLAAGLGPCPLGHKCGATPQKPSEEPGGALAARRKGIHSPFPSSSTTGTSPFPVLALLHSRSVVQLLLCAFSPGTRHPQKVSQKVSVAPALLRGCPRCGRGRARTAGSAALVLLAEQRHVPGWAGLGVGSKIPNVWSWLLENTGQENGSVFGAA